MFKALLAGMFGILVFANAADAQICAAIPFANSATADADQLNNYLTCLAPLANPLFTGEVGIGTTAPTTALTVKKSTAYATSDQVAIFDDISTDAYGDIHEIARFGRTNFGGASASASILATGYNLSGYFASNLITSSGVLSRDYASRSGGYLAISNSAASSARSIFQFGGIDNGGTPYTSLTVSASGNVGIGTTTPTQALEVVGEVKVDAFASASGTAVCENAGVLSSCSSSIRYKENVEPATFGLNEIEQMRPVTFKWRGREESDFGLIAEEVAKINPLFATYKDGQIEGVKYAQIAAVLINAIKQLDATNKKLSAGSRAQGAQIAELERRIRALESESVRRTADSRESDSYEPQNR